MFSPLYSLQSEVNRIFIAGSKFAIGDPRIKKQLPQLEKLGEKVPIIKKIKEETEKLLESTTENASDNLFKLSILLYSVINSITDSKFEEEKQDIIKDKNYKNQETIQVTMPYSIYLDIKQMLLGDKKADYDFLESILTKENLKDFRIMPHILKSIDSKKYALSEFILKKIFPLLDDKAIPYLLESFDMTKNTISNANKLKAIYDIEPNFDDDLLKKIIEDNDASEQCKIVAIEKLIDMQYEYLLLPLIKDRKKSIREAAFTSLSKMGSQSWIDEGLKILDGKDPSIVYEAFRYCTDQKIYDVLFDNIEKFYKTLDFKPENLIVFNQKLLLLTGKGHEKQTFDFIFAYLTNKSLPKNLNYQIERSFEFVYTMIDDFNDQYYIQYLFENYKLLKSPKLNFIFEKYLIKCIDNLSKEEIYDKFSELVKNHTYTSDFIYAFRAEKHYKDIYIKDDFIEFYNTDKIDERFADIIIDLCIANCKKKSYYVNNEIFFALMTLEKDSPKIKTLINLMQNQKNKSRQYYIKQFIFLLNLGYDILDIVIDILTKEKFYYYEKIYINNEKAFINIPKSFAKTFGDLFDKNNDLFYKDIEQLLLEVGSE